MRDAVIVSGVRTALGRLGGALSGVLPEELAAVVTRAAIERAGLAPGQIDEVVFGQTKQSADAPNIARVAALKAGLPVETPAYTVHRQCGSGLQAVNNAVQAVWCGLADVVVAGGTESMSCAPFYLRNARFGYRSGNGVLVDPNTESQPKSQPEDVFGRFTMGETAENLAEMYGISRAEQDRFALRSHERALAATRSGRFAEEIVPVSVPQKKGPPQGVVVDEQPRETSLDLLTRLPAVFREGGTVTAGNSSSRNDGAAALVIMAAEKAREMGVRPLAVVRSQAAAGVPPHLMGIGPARATPLALARAGVTLADVGLVELNEAFAAQSLAVIKELGLNEAITNVNGGAIALGHPLGCSGARILVTLLYEMRRRGVRYGLATICIAGGMGISDVVELVD